MARTWILTGSPENHAATADRGYSLIGLELLVSRLSATAGVAGV